jgi:uncharacterized protein (DUF488 family)
MNARSPRDDRIMTTIYTIGHSNHQVEEFLALLRQHGIELVADVRSSPYSRYVPQANREALSRALEPAGIAYRWLGDRLGGKPQGRTADYDELRGDPAFRQGIVDLLALAAEQRIAIMCAEGDHQQCHRHQLITPVLIEHGIHVLHIQPGGALVDEDQEPKQLALF